MNDVDLSLGGVSYETSMGVFIQLHKALGLWKRLGGLDRNELIIHELVHATRYEKKYGVEFNENI